MASVAPDELGRWLEWASAKLIAMPGGRVGPHAPTTFWPDFSQDRFQVLEFRKRLSLRAMAPSSDEITLMEEVLELPLLCTDETKRRIIYRRALVHPLNYRHLYTWAQIAEKFGMKLYSAKNLHQQGLVEIRRRLPPARGERLATAMDMALAQ